MGALVWNRRFSIWDSTPPASRQLTKRHFTMMHDVPTTRTPMMTIARKNERILSLPRFLQPRPTNFEGVTIHLAWRELNAFDLGGQREPIMKSIIEREEDRKEKACFRTLVG